MSIIQATLAGGVEIVPAGYCKISLQIMTPDGLNLSTASWSLSGGGQTYSASADASGRASVLVASGTTYTVTLTHQGDYFNDGAQTVVADSAECKLVIFELGKASSWLFTDQVASSWASDATYADYPYRCALALNGVTSSDLVEVIYGVTEAISGDYAPVCQTYDGGVYLYSKVDDTITIPSINVTRYRDDRALPLLQPQAGLYQAIRRQAHPPLQDEPQSSEVQRPQGRTADQERGQQSVIQ